jgi:hypothetical protein
LPFRRQGSPQQAPDLHLTLWPGPTSNMPRTCVVHNLSDISFFPFYYLFYTTKIFVGTCKYTHICNNSRFKW